MDNRHLELDAQAQENIRDGNSRSSRDYTILTITYQDEDAPEFMMGRTVLKRYRPGFLNPIQLGALSLLEQATSPLAA